MLLSQGYVRRPCLVLKDESGRYETVQVFKSKKDAEPMLVLKLGELSPAIVDDVVLADGSKVSCFRAYKFFRLTEEADQLSVWAGRAFECDNDLVWHPKSLYKEIVENVGYYTTSSSRGGKIPFFTKELMLPTWEAYSNWQADCLEYFIQNDRYDLIMTHLHNVDGIGHSLWPHAIANKHTDPADIAVNREYVIEAYRQTDRYLGRFLKYIDEGWNIIITSDHGLLIEREEEPALMGDAFGVNAKVMDDLGLTVLKRDADGNITKEIDWDKTIAIAPRTCHIYLNIKGRDAYGIVDPADQYALEEEIISALYNYRNADGQRVFSVVLRNKEAAILGMDGPECGDLIYFIAEGFNRIHGDSLSTYQGYFSSSVSPIFIAAGKGIKQGYTDRVIRQVDVAPTIAALVGTRMPHQSEGSVVHQILDC